MNKIYKVVWNAARNCYVVGSEFISKTRRGEGYRSNVTTAGARTLLAVCAACGISFYSGGLAVAADNLQTEPTIVIEVQEQKNEAVQPELLYSQLAAASASADALDITMPADVPAAAEDTSEAPAVDVSSQHSIHDENGYYVYNGTKNDTYNSLTKDGLWVGGVDDKTGFHVDNTGHASANGLDVQNKKITGVAYGEFRADSTDAVTAGQLYDAGIVPGKAADGSVAIGNGSNVTNINGVAIGNKALVNYSVENGVAIGQGAEVRTDNATAIGQGSRVVSGDGSVALGQGSMVTATDAKGTDAHGVVSVGLTGNKVKEGFTRRIINVADGINDSDAATYGQVKDVDAKLGDLDFSDTHSLEEAENVTDALTKLDTKAYNLSGKFDDFSRSGIMAGGTDAESRHAGADSIQLGNQSRAEGQQSIALGVHAKVTGENTEESILTRAKNNGVAIGYSATAAGFNTTVLGAAAKAQGDNATALGQGTLVTADNSVALGAGSSVTTDDIRDSDTNGVVSVGKSDGERRIINVADGVNDSDAATVGQISKITGMDSEKGNVVQYDGEDKAAVTFAGTEGTALKNVSDIELKGNSFVDAGLVAGTTTTKSTLLGNATAENNMILGDGAEIYVQGALGKAASVENSMAIGQGAEIHAQSQGSAKHITDSIAFGQDSYVSASNSVAIGAGSTATEEGVVSVGSANNQRRIVNVADGNIGENSIDAVNGSQLYAVREGAVSYGTKMEEDMWGNEKEVTDYSIVTLRGENGTKLTNLADGEFKADSTDAVTAGQLYAAGITPGDTRGNAGSVAMGGGYNNYVLGANGTAIGYNAAADKNAVAIGNSAAASHANATAVGQNSKAMETGATAFGQHAWAEVANSTAIGYHADVEYKGDNSVALGANSIVATEDILDTDTAGVVSVGSSGHAFNSTEFNRRIINVADGVNDSDAATVKQVKAVQGNVDELNKSAVTYTDNTKKAVNFNGATLKNVGDIQIGSAQSTFVGSGLVNGKVYDTDAGQWAENGAEATHSMAVGKNSSVRGTDSVAVGPEAAVNNGNAGGLEQSTAVGSNATVLSNFSTALGAHTQAKGDYSVAVGAQSQTTGDNATAIGAYAAAGENSVVVGGGEGLAAPIVSKANSTAMGTYVGIKSENGTALGYGSQIGWNGKNSVALGADSVANEENVVSVGHTKGQTNGFGGTYGEDLNRRIVNVADGVNDSDAATFGQVKDVQDSVKALDASAVQYDSVSKSTVTFDGTNGTALKNVSDIVMNTKDSYGKNAQFSFQDAGLLPGDVQSSGNKWNIAIGEGSAVKVEDGTGSKMQMNTVVGNKARITQALVDGEYQDVEKSTALGQGVTVAASNAVGVGQGSNVRGEGGVAVGMQANVSAKSGVAVGKQSKVSSDYSIAIGGSASVGSKSENSVAMGYNASSLAAGGTAIGQGAKVQGSAANGTAIGKGAIVNVNAGNSVALGASSQVQTADIGSDTEYGVVSVGKSGTNGFTRRIVNVADGLNDSDAATVGQLNAVQSAYTNSGIVGGSMDNNTLATGAVAIGKGSNVHGTGSIAIGTGSKVEKHNSVAIGRNAIVKGAGSVALGASSVATEDNVLSLGRNDGSLGLRIVNMKDGINERDAVTVGQMNELAFGTRSGSRLLANGATNLADGIDRNTTAIKSLDEQLDDVKADWGESTQSMKELTETASAFAAQTQNVDWNALNSVDWNAVNAMAAVPATMNLAVDDVPANEGGTGAEKDDDERSPQTNGSNPGEVDGNLHVSGNTTLDGTLNVKGDATFEGNATFDKGATMKGDLNMSGNKITGLGAGDVSADSTDAVNGSQLFDVQQQVSDNRNAIGALGSRVSDLGEEVDSVGAISAALAGLHPLDYNGTGSKFQISAALGTYDGTQAAAIGGFYHFNRDTLLSIGGSTSFEGDRKTAANVGVTFRVGEGASEAPAVQDNETKQQMEAMKQEIEMLKAELEQLKNKDTEGTNAKN